MGVEDWLIEKAIELGAKGSWNLLQKERKFRSDMDSKVDELFDMLMEIGYGESITDSQLAFLTTSDNL